MARFSIRQLGTHLVVMDHATEQVTPMGDLTRTYDRADVDRMLELADELTEHLIAQPETAPKWKWLGFGEACKFYGWRVTKKYSPVAGRFSLGGKPVIVVADDMVSRCAKCGYLHKFGQGCPNGCSLGGEPMSTGLCVKCGRKHDLGIGCSSFSRQREVLKIQKPKKDPGRCANCGHTHHSHERGFNCNQPCHTGYYHHRGVTMCPCLSYRPYKKRRKP